MTLLNFIKNLHLKLLIWKANSHTIADVYRKHFGVKIGSNARFSSKNIIFGSEPYLIQIGNDVTITGGVRFITHDGGAAVFRKEFPGINVYGEIKIGNNVFVGNNVMIMPGVTIGNNVVIGAGSVVTHDIQNNSVAAGIPAKVLKTIEEYKQKVLRNAIYVLTKDYETKKRIIYEGIADQNRDAHDRS